MQDLQREVGKYFAAIRLNAAIILAVVAVVGIGSGSGSGSGLILIREAEKYRRWQDEKIEKITEITDLA